MNLTASKVHAARQCGYRFRSDVRTRPRESGKAAILGTAAHEMLESALRREVREVGDSEEQRLAVRHAANATAWVQEFERTLPGPTIVRHIERGFVYDLRNDTAEFGPRRGEPGYNDSPRGCIRGTFDLVWIADGEIWVVDYKTGKVENAHIDQLYAQAVAASRIFGVKTVHIGFLFSRLTKVIPPKFETMHEDELDVEAGRLGMLARKLPTAEPTPGEWCRWCEVIPGDCPAISLAEAIQETGI